MNFRTLLQTRSNLIEAGKISKNAKVLERIEYLNAVSSVILANAELRMKLRSKNGEHF